MPPVATGTRALAGICGRPIGSRPVGTGPTVTTPRSASPSAAERAIPPTSTMRPQGTLGANREPTNRITRAPTPRAAVMGVNCWISPRIDHARLMTSPETGGSPSRLGISPRMMRSTSPKTNPVTIGRDMNSAAHPRRAIPPMRSPTPAPIASADVREIASAASPWDMSATRDPDSTETVETGPTTRCGEDPSTA
jgi:hypothetical protein